MTTAQKLIKYCALAFAAFLVITIISGAVKGVGLIGRIIDRSNGKGTVISAGSSQSYNDISSIDMDIKNAEVYIKSGDTFSAEANSDKIKINQKNNKLVIEEEAFDWFDDTEKYITIYVPKTLVFDRVDMSTGAGIINIEFLNTNNLDMELGAGKATINEINVYNKTEIEGGAGQVIIKSAQFSNLTMDMGVGSTEVNAKITGESQLDMGIGKLDLNLVGSASEYTFDISKGIGNIAVDDVNVKDGSIIGSGANKISLDGGIGNITVTYTN